MACELFSGLASLRAAFPAPLVPQLHEREVRTAAITQTGLKILRPAIRTVRGDYPR